VPASFKMNPHFPAEVLHDAELRRYMEERAKPVAERAERLVQEYDPDEHVTVEMVEDGRGHVARVTNHDWKWRFFEFGTVKMDARPALRPALAAEGLPPAPVDGGGE
jgi:hypothetical protein